MVVQRGQVGLVARGDVEGGAGIEDSVPKKILIISSIVLWSGAGRGRNGLRKPQIHDPGRSLVLEHVPIPTRFLQRRDVQRIDLSVLFAQVVEVAQEPGHEGELGDVVARQRAVLHIGQGVFVQCEGRDDAAEGDVETALSIF